jgi:hypothetical protein
VVDAVVDLVHDLVVRLELAGEQEDVVVRIRLASSPAAAGEMVERTH